jgi:hypothetical protein
VRIFCRRVGFASSLAMALLVATPLFRVYLRHVAGLPDRLSRFVISGTLLALAVPLINSVHSWYRGLLMHGRNTRVIYQGMGLNLALTTVCVAAGVLLKTPGGETAVFAITLAMVVEIYFLKRKLRCGW